MYLTGRSPADDTSASPARAGTSLVASAATRVRAARRGGVSRLGPETSGVRGGRMCLCQGPPGPRDRSPVPSRAGCHSCCLTRPDGRVKRHERRVSGGDQAAPGGRSPNLGGGTLTTVLRRGPDLRSLESTYPERVAIGRSSMKAVVVVSIRGRWPPGAGGGGSRARLA